MIIEQTYVDKPKERKEVSIERFLELTEGRGHYAKGTALETLKTGGTIRTPFSYFNIKKTK